MARGGAQDEQEVGDTCPGSDGHDVRESSFVHDAQPPMQYFLFIPTGRASSAYGYAQVKDETWADYQRETGNGWSDRDDFADAIDFMGWYTHKAQRLNGTSKWDAYGQYLNYHEGWGATDVAATAARDG